MKKNVFAVLAVAVLVGAVLAPGVGYAEEKKVDQSTIEGILRILKDLERQIRDLDLRATSKTPAIKEIKKELKKNSDDDDDNDDDDKNKGNGSSKKNELVSGWITLPELPGNIKVACALPELKKAHKKDAVYLLQLALKRDGSYPEGWITGYFGGMTETAVRTFQKKNGIPETGAVDAKTVAVLNGLIRGWYADACAGTVLPPGQLQKFEGTVKVLGPTIQMWGTHQLFGENGKTEMLKAVNDSVLRDLKNTEGKSVHVWGIREYQNIEGGFWGITVHKVVIRGNSPSVSTSTSSLKVLSPAEGTSVKPGDVLTVRWDGKDFPGSLGFVYRIELVQQAVVRVLGEVNSTSTGEFAHTWTVPTDLSEGVYRVQVVQLQNIVCITTPCNPIEFSRGTSGWFKIYKPVSVSLPAVSMEAVSPLAPVTIGLGSGQTIGVFKIKNTGSSNVYLDYITFANGGVATSAVTYDLYASQAGGSSGDVTVSYTTGNLSTGFGSISGTSENDRIIPGGSWRYLTVKTRGVAVENDTFQLGVSSLQSVTYAAKESDLGYSANGDSDLLDTISSLPIIGMPSLSTVTARL